MAFHLFNAEPMVRAVAMGDGRYLTFVPESLPKDPRHVQHRLTTRS